MKHSPRSILLLVLTCTSALHVAAASAQDMSFEIDTSTHELRPDRPDRDDITRNPNLRQRLLHQMRKDAAADAGAARREVGRREVREEVRRNVGAEVDAAVNSRMQSQMRENLGQNISSSAGAQVRENLRSGIAKRGGL